MHDTKQTHAADPTLIDDTPLIERTQKGDPEAFSSLVRKYDAGSTATSKNVSATPKSPKT